MWSFMIAHPACKGLLWHAPDPKPKVPVQHSCRQSLSLRRAHRVTSRAAAWLTCSGACLAVGKARPNPAPERPKRQERHIRHGSGSASCRRPRPSQKGLVTGHRGPGSGQSTLDRPSSGSTPGARRWRVRSRGRPPLYLGAMAQDFCEPKADRHRFVCSLNTVQPEAAATDIENERLHVCDVALEQVC